AKELFNDSPTITVRQVTPDVQSGKVDTAEMIVKKAEFFKGRSALVGATAMALYDLRNTPLQSNYPGPELHLTVLGNLLDQNFIQPVKKENLIVFCLILLLGLVSTYIWTHGTALSSFLVFIGTLAVIIGTEYYLFLEKNLLISGLFVVLLLVINYVGITIFRYFSEEAKKKQIKQTFSKYVAPAVVEELLKSEDNLKLGGRKEHMSVFFSDVRGFTTIAEKLTPQELSDVLNKYLSPMTELVFKNKGTLDKYMGDAIMAFFGAPVSTKHHATQACRCALDSIKKLAEIHAEFEKAGLPYIDIGIGINTGDMSVGNMGSNIVQNYTVMGDSVNLASRLEGINKQYGTRIIISEFTRKEIGENFLCREVDRVQVKGKLEPVRIFELLAEGKPDDKTAEWLASYLKSYDLYSEKKFPEAMTQFKTTMSIRESLGVKDPVSELYVERCEDYIATPPPADWDGVYVSKTK
ncbi:MAG: adenylate/guanylate cyclase domain-containing protein, partial [Bdellovibrionota bacterium]